MVYEPRRASPRNSREQHQRQERREDPNPFAYSVRRFCEKFDVSRATFYREVQAGRIHPVKIGRSTRITQAEVDRYLESLSSVA